MPSDKVQLPDWPRAHGEPLFDGRIRQTPEDFEVTEDLGWEPSDDGEHDFLWVEKTGQNTAWVATALARHAGVPPRDVGYSGLKDRHAVTRQWFSVRRPTGEGTDWRGFNVDGVAVRDVRRHNRKLKRGVHRANRFRIVARDVGADSEQLDDRLQKISSSGVPNYFGPQRFGRDGGNLDLALAFFDGRRMKRQQQSIAMSSARSYLFNEVLAERVRKDSWNAGIAGECFNLDGTNSLFTTEAIDDELRSRVLAMDIHPTGPLFGNGDPRSSGDALRLEQTVLEGFAIWTQGLCKTGASMARRALRCPIGDLDWEHGDSSVDLTFTLARGSYATAVLREILEDLSY